MKQVLDVEIIGHVDGTVVEEVLQVLRDDLISVLVELGDDGEHRPSDGEVEIVGRRDCRGSGT